MVSFCFRIVELMLMYYPNYINLQKEGDGYSLVHMAATNRQTEMMELLLQQVSCMLCIHTMTSYVAIIQQSFWCFSENL